MAGQQSIAMGYEENEHAHILTAIRQPLFIQTPLQAMLESLVDKLQVQAGVISAMQDKLSPLERTQLASHEVLDRVAVVEGRLATAAGSLSPFNQADTLARLVALEAQAGLLEEGLKAVKFEAGQVVLPRLTVCESRLAGVHNLAGQLLALDAVAGELGIAIPQPQLSSITQMEAAAAAAATSGLEPSVPAAAGLRGTGMVAAGAHSNVSDRTGLWALNAGTAWHATDLNGTSSGTSSGASPQLGSSWVCQGPGIAGPAGAESGPVQQHEQQLLQQTVSSRHMQHQDSSSSGRKNLFLLSSNSPETNVNSACSSSNSSSGSSGNLATLQQPRPDGEIAGKSTMLSTSPAAAAASTAAGSAVDAAWPGQQAAGAATVAGGGGGGGGCCLPGGAQLCGAGGVLTRSKQQELQLQIDAGKQQAVKMQQQLNDLQQAVDGLRADAASSQDQALGMMAGLQDSLQALTDRLEQQLAAVRREMKPALQQVAQVSLSDITALESKVDAAAAATAAAAKELQRIKSKELPALSAGLSDLSKRAGRCSSASVSDSERLLAGQLGLVAEAVEGLRARLDASEAEALAGQGVATKEDLQELSRLMVSKATKDDMCSVLGRAVELALEAYRSTAGDTDSTGASRMRCLVCERTLLDRSGSPPHSAPHAYSSSSTLPRFDQFRPATAMAGSCSSSSTARQACSSWHAGPGAAGEALGFGPLGPGLNAAQLRRMAEERSCGAAGPSASSCTGAGGDDSGGALMGNVHVEGSQLVGSLPLGCLTADVVDGSLLIRATTPGNSNSVRYSSTGPYSSKKQQQQQQQQEGNAGTVTQPGGALSSNVHDRPHSTGGIRLARNAAGLAAAGSAPRPSTSSNSTRANKQGQTDKSSGRRTPVFL